MRRGTVPATCALVLGLDAERRAALAGCVVRFSDRDELDLDAVAARLGEEASVVLAQYWARNRRLRVRLARGTAQDEDVVITRSERGRWAQATGRDKADLREQYDALIACGGEVAQVTEAALAARSGEGETVVSVSLYGGSVPPALGGPMTVGEVRRELVLVVRWAKWRDRKVRRLAQVTALAHEVWADPGDLRERWVQVSTGA